MKEEQVIDYIRKQPISSWFLFRLWAYSILPCWIRGHRMTREERQKWELGKTARCMKCKRKLKA